MSVARSVAEVLRDHVVLEVEAIDRMYLNVYVPHLQSVGAVVGYLRVHRGPQPGARVWSAGCNILELPVTHRDPLGWDDPVRHLVRAIEEFPAPIIAMVEGGVWGVGRARSCSPATAFSRA